MKVQHTSADHLTTRIVIRPQTDYGVADNLKDIWNSRETAWSLALREIQIRYKQSVIGVAWAVMQPLITTLIYTMIFGFLVKIPTDGVPYPVFVLSGLLLWQYFSKVLVDSAGSLVRNEAIITKVFFPRLVLPLMPALSSAVELGISLIMLLALMVFYGILPTPFVLCLPLLLFWAGLLAYGFGLMLSPINAIYRDVAIALPFFVQIGMYMTPVIYPVSFVPTNYQWIFLFNPVGTLLDTARAMLLGSPFPPALAFAILAGWTVIALVLGFRTFRKLEPAIVDRI